MKNIDLHSDVKIVLSDKSGGVSKDKYKSLNLGLHVGDDALSVNKNREIFASEFNSNLDNLVFMNQVHSNSVLVVQKNGNYICDGLITNSKDLTLCVMVADCAGVIMYDAKTKVVAALHVGRKGAFLGIITKAFQKMQTTFGSKSEDIHAFISPHIRDCCYEIDGKVLKEAQKKCNFALTKRGNRAFLSLEEMIYKEFETLNITHVKKEKICTSCDANYFSYRRDGVTGRFGIGVKIL